MKSSVLAVLEEQGTKDEDKFAHWIAGAELITEAYVMGTPLIAVCGKIFIPTRDPSKYPICPECKEIVESGD